MFYAQTGTTVYLHADNPNTMGNGKPRTITLQPLQSVDYLLNILERRNHIKFSDIPNHFTTKFDLNTITGFLKLAASGVLSKKDTK